MENYIDFAHIENEYKIIIHNYIIDFMKEEIMQNKKK